MIAQEFYQQRRLQLKEEEKRLTGIRSLFAWLRLACVLAIIATLYFLIPMGWAITAPVLVIVLFVFVQLVYRDLNNKALIAHNKILSGVNNDEIRFLEGEFYHFPDGTEHSPKEHYYANDLDIFGHASLFQYLNRTVSEMGSAQLAQWLMAPAQKEEIPARQEGVKELSLKLEWMQNLQAFGKENSLKINTRDRLQNWLREEAEFSSFKPWNWLRYLLPLISVGISICTIFSLVPMNVFYSTMLLMGIIAYRQEKKISPLHDRLGKMVDELDTLSQSIGSIEKENFQAGFLQQLQGNFRHKGTTASHEIKKLKKILDRLDLRFNIVLAVPLNLLFLWNLQQALDLEKWKKANDADVGNWFNSLGILEALGSFAVIHFNFPTWVFPTLKEEHFYIEAKDLGHPLINEAKRVNNFIRIDHRAEIMLVTGSNMAGKSTYLRSVGVNIVLMMAGAPVCASSFSMSPVQLLSSMRIADNLEESTSTFYAELKKLKTVIDKVNDHEKVFILLDEILRGTNSLDRHTGSEALIKQLIKKEAAGIIATHDVALAKLETSYPNNILNYHFDVQVSNDELYFDYKLKPGVCTSLNASILMKKIGIEI